MTLREALLTPLNTPLKRVGALILLVGVTWMVAGMADASTSRYFFSGYYRGYYYHYGGYERQPVAQAFNMIANTFSKFWYLRWAVYTMVLGLAFSYLYDIGLGRLVAWVRGVEFKTKAEVVADGIGGHKSESELDGVKGITTGDRSRSAIVSDNVTPEKVEGVVGHEVFHKHFVEFVGEENARKLFDAVGRLVGTDADITAANAKVHRDTLANYRNKEIVAYLIEDAPNNPLSKRLADRVKLALNRLGVPLDWINGNAASVRRIGALTLQDLANNDRTSHLMGEGNMMGRVPAAPATRPNPEPPIQREATPEPPAPSERVVGAKNGSVTADRLARGCSRRC